MEQIWEFLENNKDLSLLIFYSSSELGKKAIKEASLLKIKMLSIIVTKEICETFQFVKIPRYEFWYKGGHIHTEIGLRDKSELTNLILKLRTKL